MALRLLCLAGKLGSLNRAVGLTRELDPHGRWLMAAAQDFPNADEVTSSPQPRVVVDTTRLARVASWPSQWTPGSSAAQVARELGGELTDITCTHEKFVAGDFCVRRRFAQGGDKQF